MITFVDTNILLDVFLPDPVHGESSSAALEKAFHEGSLIINLELQPTHTRTKCTHFCPTYTARKIVSK